MYATVCVDGMALSHVGVVPACLVRVCCVTLASELCWNAFQMELVGTKSVTSSTMSCSLQLDSPVSSVLPVHRPTAQH